MKNKVIIYILLIPLIGITLIDCTERGEPYVPSDSWWFIKYFGRSKVDYAKDLIQTDDGGYLIAGGLTDHYTDDAIGDLQFYLLKTDKYGNQEWSLSLGDSIWEDVANSVIQTSDGNYLAVGKKGFVNSDSTAVYSNIYVVKVSSSGDTIWTKDQIKNSIGNQYDIDAGVRIFELSTGNIVVISSSGETDEPVKGLITVLDSDGNFVDDFEQPFSSLGLVPYDAIQKNIDGQETIIVLYSNDNGTSKNLSLVQYPANLANILNGKVIHLPATENDFPGQLLNSDYQDDTRFMFAATKQESGVNKTWFGRLNNNDFLTGNEDTLPTIEAVIEEGDKNLNGKSICRAQDYLGYVLLSEVEMANDQYDLKLTYVSDDGTVGYSDEEYFGQTFGYTSEEEGIKIIATSDGGYAILANSLQGNDQRIMLIKTNEKGQVK